MDIKQFRATHGDDAKSVLKTMLQKHGSQKAVADTLGVNQSTISVWMLKFGLSLKTIVIDEQEGEKAS